MPVMTVGTGEALIRGHYHERVLAMRPIAYWPLCEAAGTTARCLTSTAMNGTYSSAVNTWPIGPGIGDGNTTPQFDGTNDYVNIYTATFAAAFNPSEGSEVLWAKVANAGVWTDGTTRDAMMLYSGGNDYIAQRRTNVNNQLLSRYRAGAVSNDRNIATNTTDWFHIAITWSASANQVVVYFNGVQQGAALGPLGVWAGALNPIATCIGATSTAPANPWHGQVAHAAVYSRVLSPGEIAVLAVI